MPTNTLSTIRRRVTTRRRGLGLVFVCCATVLLSGAAPFVAGPPDSPLADAAMRRDSAKVRLLLKQGADANAAQGDGMTALHWAAHNGDAGQVRMLFVAGARVDATTRNGSYTPLHLAAKAGNAAAVAALLGAGASVNATTTSGGATPLHLAAAQGSVDVISALLEKGAKVNAPEGAWAQTPLMWAAANDRVGAIEVLLAKGAEIGAVSKVEDVTAYDKTDRAALGLRMRKVAALKAAEQPPKPVGGATATTGTVAPNAAKDSTAAAAVKTGRDSGATMTSGPGAAALPKAAAAAAVKPGGDSAAKAAPETPSLSYNQLVGKKGGLTPLLFATRQGNVASAMVLLKAGANVNQVSQGDHTSPLLMAAINGHFDLAKALLNAGADPKLASDAGTTPLYATLNVQWAAKSLYPQPTAQAQQQTDYLTLMDALIKAGADLNARLTKHLWYMSYNFDLLGVNTVGATPFWRAAYGTDVDAMKLLIKHGADPTIPTQKPAGRMRNDDASPDDSLGPKDQSGLTPIAIGGPGVFPIHAATGVGYGEGFAANSHRHAPDGWLPSVKYLVEVVGADVNARDFNGFNTLHHAAARGDNALIEYLISKGADISAVSRKGQTVADMANGPVQRVPPFLETVALAEKLGSKNNHKCKSC